MATQWICNRTALRSLMRQHPHWTNPLDAQAVGRSLSWVKKWKVRLSLAPADDLQVLLSRSRAHHAPYPRWDLPVIHRLGEMREQPPEQLQRVPGPKTLAYFLRAVSRLAGAGYRRAALESDRVEALTPPRLHPAAHPASASTLGAARPPGGSADGFQRRHHRCRGSQRGRQTPTGDRSLSLCGCGDLDLAGGPGACGLSRRDSLRDRPGLLADLWTATHAHLRS
jgi:hypothetical protein